MPAVNNGAQARTSCWQARAGTRVDWKKLGAGTQSRLALYNYKSQAGKGGHDVGQLQHCIPDAFSDGVEGRLRAKVRAVRGAWDGARS